MLWEWRDVLRQQHVLWLQISVNDLAACVQEVQTLANLPQNKTVVRCNNRGQHCGQSLTERVILRTMSEGMPLYLNALMSVSKLSPNISNTMHISARRANTIILVCM